MHDVPIGHEVAIYTTAVRRSWRSLWLRRRARLQLVTRGVLTDVTWDGTGSWLVRDMGWALSRQVAS